MSDSFIKLNCANCGAKLDVYDDMDRFACAYCGTEMVVQRRGGTVALKAVTEAIRKVQIGTDKTAAELALVRLDKEVKQLRNAYANLEDTANARRMQATQVNIFVGGGACVFLVVGIGQRSTLALVVSLALVCGLVAFARSERKAKREFDDQFQEIRKEMNEVQQEIQRNLAIVDG
jgi:DNA-directed RNA polymerase subunit RPC12/RpoP